jgi:hypothetical protein
MARAVLGNDEGLGGDHLQDRAGQRVVRIIRDRDRDRARAEPVIVMA